MKSLITSHDYRNGLNGRGLTRSFARCLQICLLLPVLLFAFSAKAGVITIAIEEYAGIPRDPWPVQIGIPVPDSVEVDALRLARVEPDETLAPVPFQVIEVVEPDWTGARREPRDPVKSVDIAFLAVLPAGTETLYRVFYDSEAGLEPAGLPETILDIEVGEELERTIDTGAVCFEIHRNSGQLLSYRLAGIEHLAAFTVPDRRRPIHHNPDVWTPPNSWGHASGWDVENEELAPRYLETRGPIVWRFKRTGMLPHSNGVETMVAYTAFAGMPFLFEASSMRFTRHTAVNAVRNNELVFSRGVHTHGVYMDHDGVISAIKAHDTEEPERSFAHIRERLLPPDIPFMGLYHAYRGHGIGMVTLDRYAHGLDGLASASNEGAHYYFYDAAGLHRDPARNFLYFTRVEVLNYDWKAWHTTVIPAGTVFAERSAVLVFPVDAAAPSPLAELERWVKKLRSPPRVRISEGIRVR